MESEAKIPKAEAAEPGLAETVLQRSCHCHSPVGREKEPSKVALPLQQSRPCVEWGCSLRFLWETGSDLQIWGTGPALRVCVGRSQCATLRPSLGALRKGNVEAAAPSLSPGTAVVHLQTSEDPCWPMTISVPLRSWEPVIEFSTLI